MLKKQTNYPTKINLPQASQQDPLTHESYGDNNINHHLNYRNPSPEYNHYYHPQIYSQVAMTQLHGNRWEGSNTPAHENNNIHTLSTTKNKPIKNNVISTNT